MPILKKIFSGADSRVAQLTKLIKSQVNPLGIANSGTSQHFLREIGFEKVGESFSPERTLALMLKEWAGVRKMPVDSQISLIEWRVFSKNFWSGYPDFTSINDWMAWRLQHEFQSHTFRHQDGWTVELLDWGKARAIEFFD